MERKLSIKKADGKTIRGVLYVPDGVKKATIVVVSHGFNSNYRELIHYAPEYIKEGIGMCFFDFCGGALVNESDGDIMEMSVLTETQDLLTVIDTISSMEEVDNNNIFLLGESQGGYVSALAASRIPDKVRGLILWYPAFILEENAKPNIIDGVACPSTIFDICVGAVYNRDAVSVDIYNEIPRYSKEVLIIHGDADKIVPISYSEKAFSTYPKATMKIIHNAGHGFEGMERYEVTNYCLEYIKNNKLYDN